MSYLIRRLPTRAIFPKSPPTISLFHTSRARLAFSESDRDTHQDIPDRDAKIDHHKNDSVQKRDKGEWKPELASNSEQTVKADKHDKSMEEMQKEGARKAQEGKQPSGSSSNSGH